MFFNFLFFLLGTRIGRLKVIFVLPKLLQVPGGHIPAPSVWPKEPLAYIEWYTRQSGVANGVHGMYQISKPKPDNYGRYPGEIIPLSNIRQSCMLFPVFKGHQEEVDWVPSNVLDKADKFLVNPWLNHYSYQTIW